MLSLVSVVRRSAWPAPWGALGSVSNTISLTGGCTLRIWGASGVRNTRNGERRTKVVPQAKQNFLPVPDYEGKGGTKDVTLGSELV